MSLPNFGLCDVTGYVARLHNWDFMHARIDPCGGAMFNGLNNIHSMNHVLQQIPDLPPIEHVLPKDHIPKIDLMPTPTAMPEAPKLDCQLHRVLDRGMKYHKFIIHKDEPADLSLLKGVYNAIAERIHLPGPDNFFSADNIESTGVAAGIQMMVVGHFGPDIIEKQLNNAKQAVYDYCLKDK